MTVIQAAFDSSLLPDAVKNTVRAEIARLAWEWFRQHLDDVILTRKILFFRVDIKVRDTRVIFEKLFGTQPV